MLHEELEGVASPTGHFLSAALSKCIPGAHKGKERVHHAAGGREYSLVVVSAVY